MLGLVFKQDRQSNNAISTRMTAAPGFNAHTREVETYVHVSNVVINCMSCTSMFGCRMYVCTYNCTIVQVYR